MSIPRSEYPRPQFVRDQWLCLNGEWQFEIDHGDSGLERGLRDRELDQRILVPFCPESELSGIEHVDFMAAVWYRREVAVPVDWQGKDVLLLRRNRMGERPGSRPASRRLRPDQLRSGWGGGPGRDGDHRGAGP